MTEHDSTELVPTDESGKLAVPAKKEVLLGVASMLRGGNAVAVWHRNPGVILAEDNTAVDTLLTIAYDQPTLFKRDRKHTVSTLESLRSTFPQVISYFNNETIEPVLEGKEILRRHLAEEARLLAEVVLDEDQGKPVKSIEILLKILIEAGDIKIYNPDSYYLIRQAHETYTLLSRSVVGRHREAQLDQSEERALVAIGQNLLLTRRIFEVSTEMEDISGEKRHQDPSQDFEGRVSQLEVISQIVLALIENGEGHRSERVKGLVITYGELLTRTLADHPERFVDLKRRLGNEAIIGQGFYKNSYWVEVPGGPDFTPAELQDFLHNS